ncbi:MAG: hypothetical protein LBU44_02695 [Mediterranea sp.]|jgi:hypothetical protein|nr:hypothetical protein [Mediterranea sp.]
MKTKKLLLTMLPALAAATSVFGQQLKREVVFTMNANEVVNQNEYALLNNRFACMTHDTITKELTFVFNGERVRTMRADSRREDDAWSLYYVNPGQEKGYIFTYKEDGKWFVNCRGVVDGGFDDVYSQNLPVGDEERELYVWEKNYDYLYKLAGLWYVCKNGESRKINFIEKVYENGLQRLNINGKSAGPYNSVPDVALTESGKYAYSFSDNGRYYLNVNGSVKGWHYNSIYSVALAQGGKYAYSYHHNGSSYMNINGVFVEGPLKYDISNLALTESGKYAYSYEDKGGYYVKMNGSIIGGPYKYDIRNLTLAENGKYGYCFHESRKYYRNMSGVVTEERDNQFLDNDCFHDSLDISSRNNEHSFSSSYKYMYVVIDGRSYGCSPAVEAWYNASKNAFVWSAVEGRELVAYEYALK